MRIKSALQIFALLTAGLCIASCKTGPSDKALQGPYFGQNPPGATSEIFMPGVVSTGLDESAIAFTPDGLECYWSVSLTGAEAIVMSRFESGRWTEPEVPSFAGRYFDGWPALRPDGKRLFFHSGRPLPAPAVGKTAAINIWYVDRTESGWSEPLPLGAPVNGSENSACPSVTRDGTLYLSKKFADGSEKICRAGWADGKFQELEILPDFINTARENFHAVISPDESYLLLPVSGREDSIGGRWNYYVSFRDPDGRWSEPVNLGPGVNSARCGGAPSVSADGKYLFLQTWTPVKEISDRGRQFSFRELVDQEMRFPSASTYDLYWVDAKIIRDLKDKNIVHSRDSLRVECQTSGPFQVNSYLVYDLQTKDAALIDAGSSMDRLLDTIEAQSLSLKYILLTHLHQDHVAGLPALKQKFPAARVGFARAEFLDKASYRSWRTLFQPPSVALWEKNAEMAALMDFDYAAIPEPDIFLEDGQEFLLGEEKIKALETAGHSRGGFSFSLADIVFPGDLLLYHETGYMDYPLASKDKIVASIRRLYASLPDDTVVLSGHGEASTIGFEAARNKTVTATEVKWAPLPPGE